MHQHQILRYQPTSEDFWSREQEVLKKTANKGKNILSIKNKFLEFEEGVKELVMTNSEDPRK